MMPICARAVVVTSTKAAGVIIAGIGCDVEAAPETAEEEQGKTDTTAVARLFSAQGPASAARS